MTPLHELWLPEKTPIIGTLFEFNDSSGGVAAFLDHLDERDVDIPFLKRVPDLPAYGRDLTHYLLFLHAVQSAPVWLNPDSRPTGPDEIPRTHEINIAVDYERPILLVYLNHTTEALKIHTFTHETAELAHRQNGPPIPLVEFRRVERYLPSRVYGERLEFDLRLHPTFFQFTVDRVEKLIRRGMNDQRGRE